MPPHGLTFEAAGHVYTLDARRVPSVTTVLRPLFNLGDIPTSVLDDARLRGTIVHQAIALHCQRDLDVERFAFDYPAYTGYLQAWITFCQVRKFRSALNEHRVASRRHQVAGTLDCLGWLDTRPVLLDFATGRPSDVAKDLQTAAYHALATEWAAEGDEQLAAFFDAAHGVVDRYAVALHADGTFALEPYRLPRDYRDFITLVDAYHVMTNRAAAARAARDQHRTTDEITTV